MGGSFKGRRNLQAQTSGEVEQLTELLTEQVTDQLAERSKRLSASEALYTFCAWLSTREQAVVMGCDHEVGEVPYLIESFIDGNGLDQPRDGFEDLIIFPGKEGSDG